MFTFGDWPGILFFESINVLNYNIITQLKIACILILVVSKVMEANVYVAIGKTAATAVGDNGVNNRS